MKKQLAAALILALLFTFVSSAAANGLPFKDVREGDAHYWAVSMLYDIGVTEGISETEFGEDHTMTREQFATFISRALGRKEEAEQRSDEDTGFEDDEDISDWARGSVAIASEMGIVEGYLDGTFRPQRPVTQAEMFTMLVRVLGVEEAAEESGEEWWTGFMELAKQLQLHEGIEDPIPEEDAVRSQMALALSNTMLCEKRGWDEGSGRMVEGTPILQENFPLKYEEMNIEGPAASIVLKVGALSFAEVSVVHTKEVGDAHYFSVASSDNARVIGAGEPLTFRGQGDQVTVEIMDENKNVLVTVKIAFATGEYAVPLEGE